jgi:hypothetical protein
MECFLKLDNIIFKSLNPYIQIPFEITNINVKKILIFKESNI